jgi:hypothetical protein
LLVERLKQINKPRIFHMNRLSLLSLFLLFGLYVQAGGQTTGELVGPRYVLDTRDPKPDLKTSFHSGPRFTLDTRELKLDPTTRVVGPRFTLDTRNRPTELFFSHSKVQENQPVGVEVGKFSVRDAGTFSFSLVAGQGSTGNKSFSLDANGVLKTAQSFDYETVNQFSIRVRVTASGGLFLEDTFVVTVTDDTNEDSDGDGFTDAEEKKAGTDPNDPNSKPGLDYGLVAYYPFDGNAQDHSGNENHGKVVGATLSTDRLGNLDQAYDFDQKNYITVEDDSGLNVSSAVSVSAWIAPPSAGFPKVQNWWEKMWVVGKNRDITSGYHLFIGEGGLLQGWVVAENNGSSTSFLLPENNDWSHCVLTYSEKMGGALYYNGKLVDSSEAAGPIICYDEKEGFSIGRLTTFNLFHFKGKIDDVRIYDRALSTTEVTTLYEQEKPNPVQITLSNNSVLENMPMGTVVGKFSGGGAANPEFVLVEGKDSGGNKYFTLSKDGTLRTAVILDYNQTKSLDIRVRYTEGPMKLEKSFTINMSENAIVPPPPLDPTDYEKKYNEALAHLEALKILDKKADADIAQRRVRLAKLDGEISVSDKSLQEANVSLAACEKECEGLGADLRAINGAIGVEDAKIYSLNGKIVDSEKQFTDLENDKSKLEEDLAEAERKGSVPHTPGWHFIDGKGWLWTSPDYFPLVYSEQVDGWMYYESGSQTPWLYFDYNTESWQEW